MSPNSVENFLSVLKETYNKELYSSHPFSIEFGSSSINRLQNTTVKGVAIATYVNLKFVHFMVENKLNIALTLFPLSFYEKRGSLDDKDHELIRSLVTHDLWVVKLPESWLYASHGGLLYFLQTLGISNVSYDYFKLSNGKTLTNWQIPSLTLKEFLLNLQHLNKNWLIGSNKLDSANLSLVFETEPFTYNDLSTLKNEGVNTIVSFNFDSKNYMLYSAEKLNYFFIPLNDFCNIALKKFAQVLQFDTATKIQSYQQDGGIIKSYHHLQDE